MEASFYIKLDNNKIKCLLCPHECTINPGNYGICKVRKNQDGTLLQDVYGLVSAMHFDPIEKKPLYHYHPGKEIFSIGSLGCNFKCSCCQNHQISQTGKNGFRGLTEMGPTEILKYVRSNPLNIGVAYTYNEPVVWYEYMLDIAGEIHQNGFQNVVVSNGYINRKPLLQLTEYTDAFNIDLKGFDDKVYRTFAGGRLKNILDSLLIIKEKGCHLEITFLVVTEINDDINQFDRMVTWISQNLGQEVPLHISRYYPSYKLDTKATSADLLWKMAKLASESLHYVYVGNLPGNTFQNTSCPACKQVIIRRDGYSVHLKNLSPDGLCLSCGHKIAIA
ncbi:MAG: AmmeMemoRadiSam system radical SAM enzyme [Bacteroidales bacterium]|nr:AmmeMemoRadiSam system radical SAM enzyme [Bacteroidales bacterium]